VKNEAVGGDACDLAIFLDDFGNECARLVDCQIRLLVATLVMIDRRAAEREGLDLGCHSLGETGIRSGCLSAF